MNAQPIVGQYFYFQDEGARDWGVKFRKDIPYGKLTRLYLSMLWLKNGQLTFGAPSTPSPEDRVTALTKACRAANPSAEVFVSSGYDDGSMYLEAAKDPPRFAASVVALLRRYGLDGYDMDWENGLDRDALNALVTATRKALDAAGQKDGKRYGLTLATWPYGNSEYDFAVLGKQLDAINLMSYGADQTIDDCMPSYQGFPTAKIIGGIDTEDGYPGPGGTDTLGASGSIAQKAGYARKNGLAGMMAWRLDNDYVVNDVSTYKGAEQLWTSMTT